MGDPPLRRPIAFCSHCGKAVILTGAGVIATHMDDTRTACPGAGFSGS